MLTKFTSLLFIKRNIGYYFIIIILAFIFCSPSFLPGKTFYALDTIENYSPWISYKKRVKPQNPLITDPVNLSVFAHKYFKDSLKKDGDIPLWNKNILCGIPFYGYYTNLLSALFYYCFSISTAHDLLLFIHLALAGIFMFAVIKKIGFCKTASLTAAIAWMFCGYNMVWFEWEDFIMFAAILPATLLVIDKYFDKRSFLLWLIIIFCFGYTICINFAHIAIYQFLFIGSYILFKFIDKFKSQTLKDRFSIFTGFITASCLSIILGLNFFISNFEMLGYGQREKLSFNELLQKTGQLPFKYLGTLFFPNLFGNPGSTLTFTPRTYISQSYNNYNELCIYIGTAALFLVFISIIRYKKDLRWIFFFAVGAYALLSAMGSYSYYPLAEFIPGLSQTTPTRTIYIFSFCMSVMAGIGMQTLIFSNHRKKNIFVISSILVVLAISLVITVNTDSGLKFLLSHKFITANNEISSNIVKYLSWKSINISRPLIFMLMCFLCIQLSLWCKGKSRRTPLVIIVFLIALELMLHGWEYNTICESKKIFPDTQGLKVLKEDIPSRIAAIGQFLPNGLAAAGLESIGGYTNLYPRNYGNFLYFSKNKKLPPKDNSYSRWVIPKGYYSPFYELINTKYLILSPNISINRNKIFKTKYKEIYNKELRVYENLFAFPRAFGTTGYRVMNTADDALEEIGRMNFQQLKNNAVLYDVKRNNHFSIKNKKSNGIIKTEILKYSVNNIIISSTSAKQGFIVVSNNWHPAWKAYVDGYKSKVFKAYGSIQAIKIPAGKHIINLQFKPVKVIAGLIVSICAWCFLLMLIIIVYTKQIYKYI